MVQSITQNTGEKMLRNLAWIKGIPEIRKRIYKSLSPQREPRPSPHFDITAMGYSGEHGTSGLGWNFRSHGGVMKKELYKGSLFFYGGHTRQCSKIIRALPGLLGSNIGTACAKHVFGHLLGPENQEALFKTNEAVNHGELVWMMRLRQR